MMFHRKLFFIDVVILASVGLPIACASDGTSDEIEPAPDASVAAPDAMAPDAAPDAEAGTETGPCSPSKLCTVPSAAVEKDVKLTSVWGSSKSDVWAVGSAGTVLHYDGAKWEKADLAGPTPEAGSSYTLRSVWLERPDDVWIADGHGIRHTTGWKGPSATEWSFLSFPTDQCTPTSVRGIGGTVWVGRGLYRGWCPWQLGRFEGWSAADPHTVPAIGAANASIAIAMPRSDEAWASFSWRPPMSEVGHRVLRLSVASGDGGASDAATPAWQTEEYDSRTQRAMPAVWGDEHAVWLAGDGGTLRRLARADMQTKRFEIVPGPVSADLKDLFGFGANDIWAVGDEGTVIHWDGTRWTKLSTPFDDADDKPNLVAVWGSSPEDVWIVGDGTMLHFQGNAP
ncbi:MAG: hypothetical protein BGO98_19715 [Myxococcales bacterium 68-20]|nr:hypothetical protein [Myxococcales bacterium]OJY22516.1 MAG: hypothetical protein BGO98_19715 [Myxococcales bacterium 68-20]